MCWACILPLTLFLPYQSKSQRIFGVDVDSKTHDKIRPYVNAGYVTSLTPGCSDCNKDSRGSIRIGVLTKGKFGFYAGYVWYNVDHFDVTDYDDKGTALLPGIDFFLLKKSVFQWYLQMGIANEKFESIYHNSSRIDTENYIIPQLGFLFHIKKFNTYAGMGTAHFNVAVGLTL